MVSSPFRLVVLVLLLHLSTVAWSLDPFPGGDFVKELNTELFEKDVRGRGVDGFYLVEFYSPMCGTQFVFLRCIIFSSSLSLLFMLFSV